MFIIKWMGKLNNYIIVSILLIIVFSCNESVNENKDECLKKLREIEIPENMMDSLSDDLRIYKENYLSFFKHKMFVIIPNDDGVCINLNIYATDFIRKEFKYDGFFYCDNFLIVVRNVGLDLDFYQNKNLNNYFEFPCDNLENSKEEHEVYSITYILKDNSFFRWTYDYEIKFHNKEKLDTNRLNEILKWE